MIFFYSFYLLVPVLDYFNFSYYEHFVVGLVLLHAYFNPGQSMLKKWAFWGMFVKSFGFTGFKVIDSFEVCDATKYDLNQDCTKASLDVVESVLLNSLCIFLAWLNARTPNGELKGAGTTVKRHTMRQRIMGVVLLIIFLSVKPIMWFMVDMNYPVIELIRDTFNNLT